MRVQSAQYRGQDNRGRPFVLNARQALQQSSRVPIVDIAGMSADSEILWQIGIDVVPSARGAGLGRALVGRLTELAFRLGKIPHYAVAVSNIRSNALAVGLGYWPAWSELYVKDSDLLVDQQLGGTVRTS